MKRRYCLPVAVMVLAALPVVGPAASGSAKGQAASVAHDKDVAAIRRILDDMTQAQNGAAFGKDFSDDVIYYDLMEDSAFGKAQFLQHIARQFAPLRNIRTRILDVHIDTDGRFGYAVSTQNFLSDTIDGQKVDQIFRETDVFEKRGTRWRIVHQHLSMPFEMSADFKTGRTLFNSRMTLPPSKR